MAASHDVFHIHSMWESIQHQASRGARHGDALRLSPERNARSVEYDQGHAAQEALLALRGRANLNGAAAMHFTSRIEKEWVDRLKLRPPAIVEPLGMNFAEYQTLPPPGTFRGKHPMIGGRKVVLFLGRIHAGKGLELLIPAMGSLKDRGAVLVIAGPDGNFRGAANELIAQHGLTDRVVFTGLVSGSEKVAALADADLLALPSYHENFGLVVVEALAAGTPVVLSDQVGLYPDVVEAGVGGVVPLDAKKLSDQIALWLDDDAMRQAASDAARVWVRSCASTGIRSRGAGRDTTSGSLGPRDDRFNQPVARRRILSNPEHQDPQASRSSSRGWLVELCGCGDNIGWPR